MTDEAEQRSGEDRRSGVVSHETLMQKLEEHDKKIARNQELIARNLELNEENTQNIESMAEDISEINQTLKPIAKGVNGMVWSVKAFLALGAIAAAATAIIVLVGHLQSFNVPRNTTDFDTDVGHVQLGG